MAEGFTARRREPLLHRLPVISHFRKSMGLQRGMLVTGIVLSAIFLLTAALAQVLSPYGFAERFDTQQPRRPHTGGARRPAGTTCSPG